MTLTLDLPSELEARIVTEAQKQGVEPAEYVMQVVDRSTPGRAALTKGEELVAYWEREGVLGAWADRDDLPDSPEYARQLREAIEAESEAQS